MNIKKPLYFLLFIIVLQSSTLLFLAEKSIIREAYKNHSSYLENHPPNLSIVYCNNGKQWNSGDSSYGYNDGRHNFKYHEASLLDSQEVKQIKSLFMQNYSRVVYAEDSSEINYHLKSDEYINYYICIDRKLMFAWVEEAFVYSGENTEASYVESWDSMYIWILFKWFAIKRENTSIS